MSSSLDRGEVVERHRLDVVAHDENAEGTLYPHRPGACAATEHEALCPLADLGLTKRDVRDLWHGSGCADRPDDRAAAGAEPTAEQNADATAGRVRSRCHNVSRQGCARRFAGKG